MPHMSNKSWAIHEQVYMLPLYSVQKFRAEVISDPQVICEYLAT